MSGRELVRSFVAIHLPAVLIAALHETIHALSDHVPRQAVRWVQKSNLHLTLRFLGDLPEKEIQSVSSALQVSVRGVAPLELSFDKLGCFPNAHSPRVIWMGVRGDLQVLSDLQTKVAEATNRWGEEDKRDFHPHVTLGRVTTLKRPELRLIGQVPERSLRLHCPPWRVDAVHLMQSVLATGGSQYTTRVSVVLAG